MSLRLKFNLVLLIVFVVGFLVTSWVSRELLQRNARNDIMHSARLMMDAATAIRGYTSTQVRPHLQLQLMRAFLPQSVPAYAATQTLSELRKKYPEYGYKEAVLNPTNPRNRVTDWEADIVTSFRNNAASREIVGERDTPTGRELYVALPIRVNDEACLTCHSTPAEAPKTMLALYGEANGFGWKMNEVIGAQVMSVPMSVPIENANRVLATFMVSLFAVFALVFVVLNVMLGALIVNPIRKMARTADAVSTGDFAVQEFGESGKDEISILAASFNRMRRSLHKAMQMLEGESS